MRKPLAMLPSNRPRHLPLAGAPEYRAVAWVFLRCLALIYLVAFWSFAGQIQGLSGSQGIYPIGEQLAWIGDRYGIWAPFFYPSLFWLDSSDRALVWACGGGSLLSVLVFATGWVWARAERPALVLLYALYLSLVLAGQELTNFQWNYLLLESGFLAIFVRGGPRLAVWLFRWLLFRLRFLSGISKLLSGDPTWSGLTALHYYFETQPLPHVGSWYANQLPHWLLSLGTAGTLVVEILVPFMILLPRPFRLLAAWLTILWQVLILMTSNHNFFNLLTLSLCLFLFDDRALAHVLPRRILERAAGSELLPPRPRPRVALAAALAAALTVPASLAAAAGMVPGLALPRWARVLSETTQPLRLADRYHVFPTIPTQRLELRISASMDGKTWRPYAFRYMPEDLGRAPPFVVPYQPRLDWMMWFLPQSPHFLDLLGRLLDRLVQASPPVLALLQSAPFGERPPLMVRVDLYRYRFATPEERRQTGHWWTREYLGPFDPLPFLVRAPTAAPKPAPGGRRSAP